MNRKASSPLAQVQMHAKSEKEFMNLVQLARDFGWSSTSATLMGAFREGSSEMFRFGDFIILEPGGITIL
jgi:hypothetical protein